MRAKNLLTGRRVAPVALVASLLPGALMAQIGPLVTTEHQILLDGKPFTYTAQAGRVPIADTETEEVHGYMFFVAYRAKGDGPPRPVTFLWNGGPGSPTSLLHFESIGPKRLQDGRLVDNQQTILPVTDLVFVDAIGTGFSRVTKEEYAREFYNTLGDIASFTEFVRAWRLLFDSAESPIFLAGESWGSHRAAGVAEGLAERGIMVGGIALISGGLGIDSNLPSGLATALRIPEWAAIALYHGKGATDLGGDTAVVKPAARAWATGTYAPALARVTTLNDAQRDSIARELSHFTGIPADVIDRKTLVITPRQFRTELLRDRGETLPNFDLRRTTPITSTPEEEETESDYLRRVIRFRTALVYVGVEGELADGYYPTGLASPDVVPRSVGMRWDYFRPGTSQEEREAQTAEAIRRGGGPPGFSLPWTREALDLNPKMKVLVATGRYDSGSCLVIQEMVQRIEAPYQGAFTSRCYNGGHMMYLDPDARVAFSADLEALIASGMPEN